MSNQLWCVHIEGLDDFIALGSREMAEQEASAINVFLESGKSQGAVVMRASAIEWPFTPESHARALAGDWHDLQRMPHRQRRTGSPQRAWTNAARHVMKLVRVVGGS